MGGESYPEPEQMQQIHSSFSAHSQTGMQLTMQSQTDSILTSCCMYQDGNIVFTTVIQILGSWIGNELSLFVWFLFGQQIIGSYFSLINKKDEGF